MAMNTPAVIERETLHTSPIRLPGKGFTEEQFFEFCMLNRDLKIERNAEGKIIVMSPTTSFTGMLNARISGKLFLWNEASRLGEVFDSSSGFTLPNGAVRSPDVSWIRKDRWDALPQAEKERFAAICPDFIVELRSDSDNLGELQDKMAEYMSAGCAMAWLVDPEKRQTSVYSARAELAIIPFHETLSGAETLPGFTLIMADIIPAI